MGEPRYRPTAQIEQYIFLAEFDGRKINPKFTAGAIEIGEDWPNHEFCTFVVVVMQDVLRRSHLKFRIRPDGPIKSYEFENCHERQWCFSTTSIKALPKRQIDYKVRPLRARSLARTKSAGFRVFTHI